MPCHDMPVQTLTWACIQAVGMHVHLQMSAGPLQAHTYVCMSMLHKQIMRVHKLWHTRLTENGTPDTTLHRTSLRRTQPDVTHIHASYIYSELILEAPTSHLEAPTSHLEAPTSHLEAPT